MRTIGTVGTIRSIRPVGSVGTINSFDSFDTLGALRTFGARHGFSGARSAAGRFLLLPGRVIRALFLLTPGILEQMLARILQSPGLRVLRAVLRVLFYRICQRYPRGIRIRERCRRAQDHRHAGHADEFFHASLPVPEQTPRKIARPCYLASTAPMLFRATKLKGEAK